VRRKGMRNTLGFGLDDRVVGTDDWEKKKGVAKEGFCSEIMAYGSRSKKKEKKRMRKKRK